MAAGQDIRVAHEEVEGFVHKLRDFHGSLGDSEQAMLERASWTPPEAR